MVRVHPQPKMVMTGKLTFFTRLQILTVTMMMLARAHTWRITELVHSFVAIPSGSLFGEESQA